MVSEKYSFLSLRAEMFMYKVLNNDTDFLSYVIAVRALTFFSYLDLLYGTENNCVQTYCYSVTAYSVIAYSVVILLCKVLFVFRRVTRIKHAHSEAAA